MNGPRPDFYALLGVAPDADSEEIRAAYRTLAKLYHPDSAAPGEESIEKFIRVQQAYDVVGDPEKREQYDLERARRAAAPEHAEQLQREFDELQARSGGPAPPAPPPKPGLFTRNRVFFVGTVLLVVGALSFIAFQQRQRALDDQITVVRVDPPRPQAETAREKGGVPPDLSVLAKEMERLSRVQVERVEAARKRMEEQIQSAERQYAAATAKPAAPAPAEPPAKVDCNGEGRTFTVNRSKDSVSVSFNGAAPEQPTIHDLGSGLVMVSGFEPTKRISLGFIKGDRHGTIVMIYDKTGNLFRTFGADCTAAFF